MTIEGDPTHLPVALRRSLTVGSLLLYGLAVIVGAGIYVAIASVIGRAGAAAPLSFLFAGIVAAMTGLCYAELARRFPEASGFGAFSVGSPPGRGSSRCRGGCRWPLAAAALAGGLIVAQVAL